MNRQTASSPSNSLNLQEALIISLHSIAAYESYVRHHVEQVKLSVLYVYNDKGCTYLRCEMVIPQVQSIAGSLLPVQVREKVDVEMEDLLCYKVHGEPLLLDDDPRKEEVRRICAACKQDDSENMKDMRHAKLTEMVQYIYLMASLRVLGASKELAVEALRNIAVEKRFTTDERMMWEKTLWDGV